MNENKHIISSDIIESFIVLYSFLSDLSQFYSVCKLFIP